MPLSRKLTLVVCSLIAGASFFSVSAGLSRMHRRISHFATGAQQQQLAALSGEAAELLEQPERLAAEPLTIDLGTAERLLIDAETGAVLIGPQDLLLPNEIATILSEPGDSGDSSRYSTPTSYAWKRLDDGRHILVVATASSALTASFATERNCILLAALIAIGVGIAGTRVIPNDLDLSFLHLTAQLDRVGSGNLRELDPYESEDELGRLARGTANRFRAHPSGGTPAAQAATIAGTARHNQPHLTTGTPSAQSAVVAGTARHQSKHTTTGDLTQQAHTLAGTARRFRAHAATGALAAQPSGVFGDAWKPQRLRPASDVSDGTWLTESEGSNLWDSINEPLPVNPADFIYTLGTSLCEVLLDPGTAPAADTEHTVLFEARGNGVADMKVQLKQGAAVIAEWTETAVPVAATRYTHTLTVPQAASITDYTDLRLVFETLP